MISCEFKIQHVFFGFEFEFFIFFSNLPVQGEENIQKLTTLLRDLNLPTLYKLPFNDNIPDFILRQISQLVLPSKSVVLIIIETRNVFCEISFMLGSKSQRFSCYMGIELQYEKQTPYASKNVVCDF